MPARLRVSAFVPGGVAFSAFGTSRLQPSMKVTSDSLQPDRVGHCLRLRPRRATNSWPQLVVHASRSRKGSPGSIQDDSTDHGVSAIVQRRRGAGHRLTDTLHADLTAIPSRIRGVAAICGIPVFPVIVSEVCASTGWSWTSPWGTSLAQDPMRSSIQQGAMDAQ